MNRIGGCSLTDSINASRGAISETHANAARLHSETEDGAPAVAPDGITCKSSSTRARWAS